MRPCTSGYFEVNAVASGRIADYSPTASLFVGIYEKPGETFKRASIYGMIDLENEDNAPHPRFTSSGGHSPEVLHHLRHIFYAHQKDKQSNVLFVDEVRNRCILFMSKTGDVLVGTEDLDFGPGAVVSFKEHHPLYNDFATLKKLIDEENQKNQERNPFHQAILRERFKTVSMFP